MKQNFSLNAYHSYIESFLEKIEELSEKEINEYISSQLTEQKKQLAYLEKNFLKTEEYDTLFHIISFLEIYQKSYRNVESKLAKRLEQISVLYKNSSNKLQFFTESLQLVEEKLQQAKKQKDSYQKQYYLKIKYYLICSKEEYLRNEKLNEFRKNFVQQYHETYLTIPNKEEYLQELRKQINYKEIITLEQHALSIFLNELQLSH